MEAFTGNEHRGVRVLGLGSEVLSDDALGILVASEVERLYPGQAEVVCSSSAGFGLLDELLGASRLLVVDTIITGGSKPGTIYVLTADQLQTAPGGSPHFLGLFEVLAVGRQLHLAVPQQTVVIAVEASDCTTVGGAIHPDVRSAIPGVVEMVGRFLETGRLDPPAG